MRALIITMNTMIVVQVTIKSQQRITKAAWARSAAATCSCLRLCCAALHILNLLNCQSRARLLPHNVTFTKAIHLRKLVVRCMTPHVFEEAEGFSFIYHALLPSPNPCLIIVIKCSKSGAVSPPTPLNPISDALARSNAHICWRRRSISSSSSNMVSSLWRGGAT